MARDAGFPFDTLFLACTRPAMRWGVPVEGLYGNVFGTAFFAMAIGRGNPLYYLLFPALHLPMVFLADRNPLFFHEWYAWLRTRAAIVGAVLHPRPREAQSGA